MNLTKSFCAIVACIAIALSGCTTITSLPELPRSKEKMVKYVADHEEYNPDWSFANNIGAQLGVHQKDVVLPKEQMESLKTANEKILSALGSSALTAAIAFNPWETASLASPFMIGAGLISLGDIMRAVAESNALPLLLAYVPDNGQSFEEAEKELMDKMQSAIESALKEMKVTDMEPHDYTYESGWRKTKTHSLVVQFNNDDKCMDGTWRGIAVKGCGATVTTFLDGSNEIQTKIPVWIDALQPAAWRFARTKMRIGELHYDAKVKSTEFLLVLAKYLPNNYFIYVPQSEVDKKPFPPIVLSNKGIFYFVKEKAP